MPATTKKLNKEVPFEADPLIWNSTISIQPLELHPFILPQLLNLLCLSDLGCHIQMQYSIFSVILTYLLSLRFGCGDKEHKFQAFEKDRNQAKLNLSWADPGDLVIKRYFETGLGSRLAGRIWKESQILTGYRIPDTGCRIQYTGYRIQITGYSYLATL